MKRPTKRGATSQKGERPRHHIGLWRLHHIVRPWGDVFTLPSVHYLVRR